MSDYRQYMDKANANITRLINETIEQRIKNFIHVWEKDNTPFLTEMSRQRLEENQQLRELLKEAIGIVGAPITLSTAQQADLLDSWLTKAKKILGEE